MNQIKDELNTTANKAQLSSGRNATPAATPAVSCNEIKITPPAEGDFFKTKRSTLKKNSKEEYQLKRID